MRFHSIPLLFCSAVLLMAAACDGAPRQPAPAKLSPATEASPAPDVALERLEVRGSGKVNRFEVEVARSPEEQAQGLMFRTELARDEGMIFPFAPPKVAAFWMKNTLIPLDMIFIRADGTIARIAAMTKPGDEALQASGEAVAAVLEIAGGEAARQGIKVGDVVAWPGLGTGA